MAAIQGTGQIVSYPHSPPPMGKRSWKSPEVSVTRILQDRQSTSLQEKTFRGAQHYLRTAGKEGSRRFIRYAPRDDIPHHAEICAMDCTS